jgi:N-methylhydantoinase A
VEPTLTDANLVLGRLDPDYFLGGGLPLDRQAACRSFEPLARRLGLEVEQAALSVVRVANENMAAAIHERTVEVGIDIRGFALVAFGGAGPLHACAIARALGILRVLVPPHPGLCSAFGAATAELRSDRMATVHFRSDTVRADDVDAIVARLAGEACAELRAEGLEDEPAISTRLGLRYAGQNYEHTVELAGARIDDETVLRAFAEFEELHDRSYGYDLRGQAIELVELVVTARAPSRRSPPAGDGVQPAPHRRRPVILQQGAAEAVVVRRSSLAPGETLAGPAIVEEPDSTVLLGHDDTLLVLPDRTLSIDVAG